MPPLASRAHSEVAHLDPCIMKIPHFKPELPAFLILLCVAPLGCGDESEKIVDQEVTPQPQIQPAATLPRPTPPETLDPISARIIGKRAGLLVTNPDAATWTNYADACLMNLWPAEAVVGYQQALALPDVDVASIRWRLARAHQDLGAYDEAEAEAIATLELAPDYAPGWLELASRRLDNGDLEGAREALTRADPGKVGPLRHAVVSIPLDLQSGRMPAAKETLEALLLERPDRTVNRLAVMVGQATNDQELIARHLPNASEGLMRFNDPWIGKIAPLARHERADLVRAISLREQLPPQKALAQVRRLIQDRPNLPMLRVVAASILKDTGRLPQAKVALDAVHELNPPDHEYWALDGLVHFQLAKLGDVTLMDRARTSSDRAIEINPTIAYGWQIRAFIHEEDSEWIEAATAFELAAEHATSEAERARSLEDASRCRQMVSRP